MADVEYRLVSGINGLNEAAQDRWRFLDTVEVRRRGSTEEVLFLVERERKIGNWTPADGD